MAPHAEEINGSSNGAGYSNGSAATVAQDIFTVNSPNVTYTDAEIKSKYTYRTTQVEVNADGKYVATATDRHTNVPALISQLAEENQQVVFVGEWARFEEELRQALPDAQFASDNLPHAANVLPLVTDAQVLTDMTAVALRRQKVETPSSHKKRRRKRLAILAIKVLVACANF